MVKRPICSEQGQVAGHLKGFDELTAAIQCGEYLDSWDTASF
jgi:hypothetical protein